MSFRFARQKRSCPLCLAVYLQPIIACPADESPLVCFPQDPLIGTTVGTRYQVQSVLCEGAVGRVYSASGPDGARVLVKVLYGELAARKRVRQCFLREAESAGRVVHPNVVPVIDVGETVSGMPFLVTPHVKGQLVAQLVKHEVPLSLRSASAIFREVCCGVAGIHQCAIVHRNLRASSVILTADMDDCVPKVLDLGIALVMNAIGTNRFTSSRSIERSAAYTAPEGLTSARTDHRADLFSLGVLFYELLSGVLPYQGSALRRVITSSAPPPIRERVPGLRVHPAAEAIALRLMQPDPADRYEDAIEIIAALDALS